MRGGDTNHFLWSGYVVDAPEERFEASGRRYPGNAGGGGFALVEDAVGNTLRQTQRKAAGGSALPVLVVGIIGIAAVRLLLGALANGLLERRFRVWRIEDDEKHAGPDFSLAGGAAALALTLLVIPIAAPRFGGYGTAFLTSMPVDQRWHTDAAIWLDGAISSLSQSIRPLALGVTRGLDWALGLLETGLTQTPWPIVGAITLALAWQLADIRVAIFTFVALAYLALLGFWEKSLQTIALLGTAALISIAIGHPARRA